MPISFAAIRHAAFATAFATCVLANDAVLAGDFPVTIDHFYGETVIPAEPVRIVTLGWMAQDIVAALGVTPVAAPKVTWGDDGNGYLPWFADALARIGSERPALLNVEDGTPYEVILALNPDLILAPVSGIEADEYERLSAIAPTVAFDKSPWAGRWQDVTLTVGTALGKATEAETLIAETDAAIAAERAAHPEFEGKSAIFAYIVADSGVMHVYSRDTSRVQMLEDLGFVSPAVIDLLKEDSDVSTEQLGTMDADVLVSWHNDPAEIEFVKTNPVFARYRPVAEGHYVGFADPSQVMALVAPTPLAVQWSLQFLVTDLANVLK